MPPGAIRFFDISARQKDKIDHPPIDAGMTGQPGLLL